MRTVRSCDAVRIRLTKEGRMVQMGPSSEENARTTTSYPIG
jgi:hypothetical protein